MASPAVLSRLSAFVDAATDEKHFPDGDWGAIFALIDVLSTSPDENTRPVLQIVIRKLQTTRHNTKIQLLTLLLLDTCIKNCGDFFCNHMGSLEFLGEIEKMALMPQFDQNVRNRIVELIREWAQFCTTPNRAFQIAFNNISHPNNRSSYGQQQPQSQLDRYQQQQQQQSSQQQPQQQQQPQSIYPHQSHRQSHRPQPQSQSQPYPQSQPPPAIPVEKIQKDLDVVREHTLALQTVVTNGTQNPEALKRDETSKQKYAFCKEMQRRMISLIQNIPNTDEEHTYLMMDLITVNDALSAVISAYEDILRKLPPKPDSVVMPSRVSPPTVSQPQPQRQQNLLDLDDVILETPSPPPPQQPQQPSQQPNPPQQDPLSLDDLIAYAAAPSSSSSSAQLSSEANHQGSSLDDEFEALALRNSPNSQQPEVMAPSSANAPVGSSVNGGSHASAQAQLDDFDREFDALAKRDASPRVPPPAQSSPNPSAVDDFELFLNHRISNLSIGGSAPPRPQATASISGGASQVSSRTQKKLDKASDQMFEL